MLLDSIYGIAESKALDLWESSSIQEFDTRIHGVTNDFTKTKKSGIVIIVSGIPRKPDMSRDDLIEINTKIVKHVTEQVVLYSPDAIIIVVSNPLDVMCYATYLTSKFPANRVMGMSGLLDVARYRAFIAEELDISPKDIQAIILGGHGLIQERKIDSDEIIEFEVRGEKMEAIHMLPGYTHNIINLSDTEDLVTVMWANESFDANKPDTFFEEV